MKKIKEGEIGGVWLSAKGRKMVEEGGGSDGEDRF